MRNAGRAPRIVWIAALALAVAGCQRARALESLRCPDCNVLLISIDTLRADHLGVYGYSRPTSPEIDRFAKQAVLFEQSVDTGGGTLPVHASLFTSVPPTEHGVWSDSKTVLDPRRVTLAEQLQTAGYHTRGYTGGGFVRAAFGLAQGFDYFYDDGGNFAVEMPLLQHWLESERDASQKFFVFLHTYDVHSTDGNLPYDRPEDFNRRFTASYHGSFDGCRWGLCASLALEHYNALVLSRKWTPQDAFSADDLEYMRGLYDGGISYVDRELGKLFARLRELGLLDRTLVVLTADHGEEFLEHHLFLHNQNTEEIVRTPLLIRFPDAAYGGTRIGKLVSTLEVMPTILDVVGVQPNREVEGRSLLPIIARGAKGLDFVYIGHAAPKLRTPAYSMFMDPDGTPESLYDLLQDPGETRNLALARPGVVASLHALAMKERSRQEKIALALAHEPAAGPQLSEEDRQKLRSLGYVQ